MSEKYKQDRKSGKFVPTGEPVMAQKPVGVRLPIEIDAAIRNMPDRAEFLREVITKAVLEREQQQSNSAA